MKPEHMAKEAERLLHDEVLLAAIHQVQQEAMSGLVTADVDNKTQILRLQAQVQVCAEILDVLGAMVIRQQQNGDSEGNLA